MGRFYADLNRLKQGEIFSTAILHSKLSGIPLVESLVKPARSTDWDGDVVMADALSSSPVGPFKEKINFDWFQFDGNTILPPKSPNFSPNSPATQSPKLNLSTASPKSYFHDDSPVKPATPEKSSTKLAHPTASHPRSPPVVLPPPLKPLNWVWQCHQCRSRYQLSVTRRCLIDGHYYCSGDISPNQRNHKRRRKAQSCTSEFDYIGWQEWGQWRRKSTALRAYASGEAAPKLHGCEGCSFPSQCRYESRPSIETIDFEKHIEEKDILIMKRQEVEQAISPKKAAFAEELSKMSKGQDNQIVTRAAKKKGQKLAKMEAPRERLSQKNATEKVSKRQRFYSSLAGYASSAGPSPTIETSNRFARGKFNPSLPSVSSTAEKMPTSIVPTDPALSTEGHSHSNGKHTDLEAIDATLKAALAGQRSASKPSSPTSTSRPQSLTQSQSQSPPSSSPIFKRRINSNPNNPESEITPRDIFNTITAGGSKNSPVPPSRASLILPRTHSQQSLLTEFFRQAKSHKDKDRDRNKESEKSYAEKIRRAASEADIASFLQLRTGRDGAIPSASTSTSTSASSASGTWSERQRASTGPYDIASVGGVKHFEDINLSPVTNARRKIFSGLLPPPGLGFKANGDTCIDVDCTKRQLPVEETGGSDRSSGPFGLLSVDFRRK